MLIGTILGMISNVPLWLISFIVGATLSGMLAYFLDRKRALAKLRISELELEIKGLNQRLHPKDGKSS